MLNFILIFTLVSYDPDLIFLIFAFKMNLVIQFNAKIEYNPDFGGCKQQKNKHSLIFFKFIYNNRYTNINNMNSSLNIGWPQLEYYNRTSIHKMWSKFWKSSKCKFVLHNSRRELYRELYSSESELQIRRWVNFLE